MKKECVSGGRRMEIWKHKITVSCFFNRQFWPMKGAMCSYCSLLAPFNVNKWEKASFSEALWKEIIFPFFSNSYFKVQKLNADVHVSSKYEKHVFSLIMPPSHQVASDLYLCSVRLLHPSEVHTLSKRKERSSPRIFHMTLEWHVSH